MGKHTLNTKSDEVSCLQLALKRFKKILWRLALQRRNKYSKKSKEQRRKTVTRETVRQRRNKYSKTYSSWGILMKQILIYLSCPYNFPVNFTLFQKFIFKFLMSVSGEST